MKLSTLFLQTEKPPWSDHPITTTISNLVISILNKQPALERLLPHISSHIVASVIQQNPNPQLGFGFFIWASRTGFRLLHLGFGFVSASSSGFRLLHLGFPNWVSASSSGLPDLNTSVALSETIFIPLTCTETLSKTSKKTLHFHFPMLLGLDFRVCSNGYC